ncbi:MAG: carboxypeptidase regulatory-like domain-containing protein [Planctomycetes bacterium]|nr:carboxypeptidase regulatory-like domain-containing protein [Planctomycetota bacterium]
MAGKRDILFVVLLAIALGVIVSFIAPWLLELRAIDEPSGPAPGIPLKPLRPPPPKPQPDPAPSPVVEQPLRAQPGKAALKLRVLDGRNKQLLEAAVDVIPAENIRSWKEQPLAMQARFGLKCSATKASSWDDLPPVDHCILRVRYTAYADAVFGPLALKANTVTDLDDLSLQRLVSAKIKVVLPVGLRTVGNLMVVKQWPLDDLGWRVPRLATQVGKMGSFEFLLTPGRWSAFDGAHYQHEPAGEGDLYHHARPYEVPLTVPPNWRFDFEIGQDDIEVRYTPAIIVGNGSISGVVVDVTGAPLADSPVRCLRTAPLPVPQDFCWLRTDSAGEFSFDALPDGKYVIVADPDYDRRASISSAQCVVTLNERTQDPAVIKLELAKKDLRILVTKRGIPQPNMIVSIEEGTDRLPDRRTDARGIATFEKYALGSYRVRGGYPELLAHGRDKVGTHRIELLPPGTGDVNLRFTQDGKPIDRRHSDVWARFYDRKGCWKGYGPMPEGAYEAVIEGSDFGPLLVQNVGVVSGAELTRTIELGKTFALRFKPPIEEADVSYELRLTTTHGFEASRTHWPYKGNRIEGVPSGKYQFWAVPNYRRDKCWFAEVEVVDRGVEITQWSEVEYRWPNTGTRLEKIQQRYPEGFVVEPQFSLAVAFSDAPPVADLLCATVQIVGSRCDSEVMIQWPDLLANGVADGRTRLHARQIDAKPQLFAPKLPLDATGLVLRVPGYRDLHIALDDEIRRRGAVTVTLQKD